MSGEAHSITDAPRAGRRGLRSLYLHRCRRRRRRRAPTVLFYFSVPPCPFLFSRSLRAGLSRRTIAQDRSLSAAAPIPIEMSMSRARRLWALKASRLINHMKSAPRPLTEITRVIHDNFYPALSHTILSD